MNYKLIAVSTGAAALVFLIWVIIGFWWLSILNTFLWLCLFAAFLGAIAVGYVVFQRDATGRRPALTMTVAAVVLALIWPLFMFFVGLSLETGLRNPLAPGPGIHPPAVGQKNHDEPEAKDDDVLAGKRKDWQDAMGNAFEKGKKAAGVDDGPINALPAQAGKIPKQKGVSISDGYYGARHIDFTIPGVEGPAVKTGVFCHRYQGVHISTPVCLDLQTVSIGWRERGGLKPVQPKAIPAHEFFVTPKVNPSPFRFRLESLDHGEVVIFTDGFPPGSYRFTVKPIGTVGPHESAPGVLAKRIYK